MATTIEFKNSTEKTELRDAFDNGLPLDTDKNIQNHTLVGRDDDRQGYSLLETKQFARQFNNLGDGRSVRYVHISALPSSAQAAKHDKI